MTKILISIVGPTAIGKTALSIKLAQHFNTEIISADSRQFFKEMTVGTAVPSTEELNTTKHHFIQHISIKDNYSVGDFERDAISKIESIHKNNDIAIMVGGSGLYVKAVTKGLDHFPDVDKHIRTELNKRLINEGIETLQKQLKSLDFKAYQSIAIDNPQRIIRALEVCIGSGQPYSSFLTKTEKTRPFKVVTIGLSAVRSIIYDRINQRVDIMVNEGLIEEAKELLPNKHLNALNTVGYKELFNYFEGEWTLDFAISEIKKNTRRFAKRQLTWFKKDETIQWFDYTTDINNIINYLEKQS
ncbi:tRNA (adenosine(37)-N6)-dimethylallyltransferase MiaA [Winogradskyella sp. J14-2]|uniref:tRNA (adenosine(37)-N6)-dimethylallyltransferase MiaA n=1 Tax=Winogradskyella sp. J14-2 TaxID=1936080 RepID=UPI00097269F6|nr:tRNA (adenosine(37)-N6)-dimethylallyltransferase MiaA [Winogradskyella sp. J14-2]APY07433.1 tRNA (adenosine(37)-N6)-dimethylallyltransferase MiaA [Winogradskyella sp. J14-2]